MSGQQRGRLVDLRGGAAGISHDGVEHEAVAVLDQDARLMIAEPRLLQRAIDSEVLVREESPRRGLLDDGSEEALGDVAGEHAVAIPGEASWHATRGRPSPAPRTTGTGD